MSLHSNYKVNEIYGSQYGFSSLLGLDGYELIKLNPEIVKSYFFPLLLPHLKYTIG